MPNDSISTADSDDFRALVETCLERFEAEGESALEALCAEHPEHAARLRRRLRTLVSSGLVSQPGSGTGTGFPERLGDFRLLRPLGGGGMGMVFLARQESLGREVAVKVIRPEYAFFAGSKDRFRREVEAVARLEHPSIVPIHVVGEEGGVPFFAMERLRGASLADVIAALRDRPARELTGADLERVVVKAAEIDRRSSHTSGDLFGGSWVQVCFRIAREVALALQHAHERGILHRDVKPSNVMVTPPGRVVLLDFGLAHAEGTKDLTRTGSVLGSLPYMAPEQVRGDGHAVDARTDVYALGVTLYELLSLSLPYAGETGEQTRSLVLAGQPPPIARTNSAVAWDAETVCLTAMERDAARRYPTAAAFAADIQSFLELRPIQARRPGPWLRARRAAQRRPALATAMAFGVLMAIFGPVGYAMIERSRSRQLAEALNEGTRQRDRAEDILTESVGTLERMARRLSADSSLSPEVDPLRARLLEEELRFLESVARQEGTAPSVRRATASALRRLVDVRRTLGRGGAAEVDLERAIAMFEELLREEPGHPQNRMELALALLDLGTCRREALAHEEAERHWRRSAELLQALVDEDEKRTACRVGLSIVEHNLSALCFATGRTAHGRRLAERVIAQREALMRQRPDQPDDWIEVSKVYENLSQSWVNAGRDDRGEEYLDRARTALVTARDKGARGAGIGIALARTDRRLGQLIARRGDFATAAAKMRQALDQFETLCRQLPDRHALHREAALTATHLAMVLVETNDRAGAEPVVSAAIAAFEPVAMAHPELPDYRDLLGSLLGTHADLVSHRLPLDESRPHFQRVLDLQQELARAHPRQPELRDHLAITLDRLAQVELRAGKLEESLATSKRCVEQRRQALQLVPDNTDFKVGLGSSLCRQAECLVRLERPDEAMPLLEEAVRQTGATRRSLQQEALSRLAGRADYDKLLQEASDG